MYSMNLSHCAMAAIGHPLDNPEVWLCQTCRFNELRVYLLVDQRREARDCWHKIVTFPRTTDCSRYEREPGAD